MHLDERRIKQTTTTSTLKVAGVKRFDWKFDILSDHPAYAFRTKLSLVKNLVL